MSFLQQDKNKVSFTFPYRITVFNLEIHYRRFFIVNRNTLKFLQIYAEFKTKANYIFHGFMKYIFVKDNYYTSDAIIEYRFAAS